MKHITKEELETRFKDSYTVGDLLDFIEKHNIPRSGKILVERVEDVYYEKNNWSTYLKEGEHFHSILRMNKKMQDEINRREKGLEPEYDKLDDPNKFIYKPTDQDKTQYTPIWSAVKYENEDKHLLLDMHY